MSLVAHYRFEGNAFDEVRAISGTEYSITYAAGKLGQAASFNGSVSYITTGYNPVDVNRTVSLWVKAANNQTSQYPRFFDNAWEMYSFGSNYGNSGNQVFVIYDGSTTAFCSIPCASIYDDTWHHIVFVVERSEQQLRAYLDGEFISSGSSSAVNQITHGGILNISHYSYSLDGLIDDFRIYDHALSVKEIKELSKAKVLHYTFDDFQEPTTNVIPDGNFTTKTLQPPYEYASSGGTLQFVDMATPIGNVALELVSTDSGEAYTAPFTTSSGALATSVAGDTWTGSCYVKGATGGESFSMFIFGLDSSYGYISLNNYSSKTITLTTQWQYFEFTYSFTNVGTEYVSTRIDADNLGDTIYVSEWQLEKKDHATLFVNGSRTAIVSDLSGQGNNSNSLAEDTTPVWTTNAKIGSGAYDFDGTNSYMTIPYKPHWDFDTGDFTYSLWINQRQLASDLGRIVFFLNRGGSAAGGQLYSQSSSAIDTFIFAFTNSLGNPTYTISSVLPVINEWYHVVITRTNGTIRMYINGEVQTDTEFSDRSVVNAAAIGIGASIAGGSKIDGYIDDVRIYSTALSANEVYDLYANRVSVDDTGTTHFRNLIESQSILITKGDQTRFVSNPGHTSMGLLTINDGNLYKFEESDSTLGNARLTGWVYLSDATYFIDRLEFTNDNNVRGIILEDNELLPVSGTWQVGWNKWDIDLLPIHYTSASTTNWEDIDYFEIYRSGLATGEDTTQYIIVRDLKIVKFSNNDKLETSVKETGKFNSIRISEIGPTDGLKAYYRLDGNAKDDISGTSGTIVGSPVVVAGIRRGAYSFDGVDDEITFSLSNNLTTDATMCGWFYWESGTASLIRDNTAANGWILAYDGAGALRYRVGGSDFSTGELASTYQNVWHHYCAVVEVGGVTRYYIDGVEVSSGSGAGSVASINPFHIMRNGANTNFVKGDVDEVRIYDRALPPEEVKTLYQIYNPSSQEKVKITEQGNMYIKGQILEN